VPVLKALEQLSLQLANFEVVVFGVENDDVFQFQESFIPHLTIKGLIGHEELMELFGKTLIYIGNSNSDGMPNTLLEAMCAGAFPIQSNPGGATSEVIDQGNNGLLIEDCEDVAAIVQVISKSLLNTDLRKNATSFNTKNTVPKIEINRVKKMVLKQYKAILLS
jgi:glycosyltransferase involved in cell wall biosynthesis